MKTWPAGSHIVMEGLADNGDLLAIGYKYNSEKILCFAYFNKNIGVTEPWCYYKACWIDQNGNIMSRCVLRPKTINKYFLHSNTVDQHNHVHQFLLWLEKHWKTEDDYFWIITTIFRICITNAWKAYRFHVGNWHQHQHILINDFADLLCHDCLNNKFSDVTYEESPLVIPGTPALTKMQTSVQRKVAKFWIATSRSLMLKWQWAHCPTQEHQNCGIKQTFMIL